MSDNVYKLAIVGYGGMGYWHSHLLEEVECIHVSGAYDIREIRQQAARDAGLHAYESLEVLLKDDCIDIVLCATPNDVHKQIVIQALRAGKNVICEKPAALSSDDFEEMMHVADESKKLLVVHQNRRWDEDYLTVKNILAQKLLGPVYRIESRVHGSRGIPGDWRQEKEHGGGMLLDWGVHILDQALQMIPEKVIQVYAVFTHMENAEVDDGFTVELTFESGLRYLLEVGTKNFIKLPRWYVVGQNGTAVIEDWNLAGKIVSLTNWCTDDVVPVRAAAGLTKTMAPRTEETTVTSNLPVVHSEVREYYRNVVDAISGHSPIQVKNQEVLRILKLMEAVKRSNEICQVVPFKLPIP